MTVSAAPSGPLSTDLRSTLIGVRALILDADGVLLLAGKPLPGAVDALKALEQAAIPYRVVTNYSSAHRRTLAAGVSRSFGMPIDPRRLITAASAAAAYTARYHLGQPLFVLASKDALGEWDGQHTLTSAEADNPDTRIGAVVIGDAGDDLSFRNLDLAFRAVRGGATFIAMHRNPWWVTSRGATLDAGALVVGLEHALGQEAIVTGKPSKTVFTDAVAALTIEAGEPRLKPRDVAMVGDDLGADIAGAHRAGLRGILVLSGKIDAAALAAAEGPGGLRGPSRPDAVGSDIGAVVEALIAAR